MWFSGFGAEVGGEGVVLSSGFCGRSTVAD